MSQNAAIEAALAERIAFLSFVRSSDTLGPLLAWRRMAKGTADTKTSLHDVWMSLPMEWRDSLRACSPHELVQLPSVRPKESFPLDLIEFINKAQRLSLEHDDAGYLKVLISSEIMHPSLTQVTSKKKYEICILSKLISQVYSLSRSNLVLDVGCGKGHLCRALTFHHGISTVGVDSDSGNIECAVKLSHKAGGIRVNAQAKQKRGNSARHDFHATPPLNIEMSPPEFLQICKIRNKETNVVLLGLHACGDLSPTILRMYTATQPSSETDNPNISAVVSVGCCYNLLTCEGESHNETLGFPMSSLLRSSNTSIDYNARMIACRNVQRWASTPDIEQRFIRDGLNFIYQSSDPSHIQEIPSEVLDKASHSISQGLEPDSLQMVSAVRDFHSWYPEGVKEIIAVDSLRCLLAPVLEALLQLDRLLYLWEAGFTQSWLVRVFEADISPRCFALVSVKDTEHPSELARLMREEWRAFPS